MDSKPIRIFISYSHENEIWLTQYLDRRKNVTNPKYLLDFWERSLRGKGVVFWFDRNENEGIRGGDKWRARIFEEIDNADIAILLITQDFVISPFIRDEELPYILTLSKEGKMEILPILLEPARLKDLDITNTFQITPGRPTPLCEYLETSENEWKKVRLEVIEAIENVIERVHRKRSLSEHYQKTDEQVEPSDNTQSETILMTSVEPTPDSEVESALEKIVPQSIVPEPEVELKPDIQTIETLKPGIGNIIFVNNTNEINGIPANASIGTITLDSREVSNNTRTPYIGAIQFVTNKNNEKRN